MLVLALPAQLALGDEIVWLTGKALGPDGKPLKGAVVVAYDDKQKIIDHAVTDEKGEYALAIPEEVLNLETKKGGGFLASVAGKIKRFVTAQAAGVAQGAKTTILALTTTQSAAQISECPGYPVVGIKESASALAAADPSYPPMR